MNVWLTFRHNVHSGIGLMGGCAAGGEWLPEMVDLAGGDQELLEPGEASRVLSWEEVRSAPRSTCAHTHTHQDIGFSAAAGGRRHRGFLKNLQGFLSDGVPAPCRSTPKTTTPGDGENPPSHRAPSRQLQAKHRRRVSSRGQAPGGRVRVAAAGEGMPPWCRVQVRGSAPEVLVMMGSGAAPTSALRATSELAALPGWWGLPAVKAGHVYIVDRSLFLRAGPRIVRTFPLPAPLHPIAVGHSPETLFRRIPLVTGVP